MRAVRAAWILIACARVFAQGIASEWFPMEVGNQWLYEHEFRNVPQSNPSIEHWQTRETITGTLAIPEGTVVLRRVEAAGATSGGWLESFFGETHYLIRNDCLYFLDPHYSWDEEAKRLRPEFRTSLAAGEVEPQFCFPLWAGKAYGKDSLPGWVPTRVVGMGPGGRFAPASVSRNAFDVLVHVVYADETHLWFEKGVGITGMWDWHNGTYSEYRVRLLRFEPAGH